MSPESSAEVRSSPAAADEELRRALARLVEQYGRAICREPQRLEAMLRDLCPTYRREIFLLVAAVREQVVSDLMVSLDVLPDDVLVARGSQRLCDSLGLSESSARWAIESWLPASRILAASPEIPLRFELPSREVDEEAESEEQARAVDWRWLAFCAAGIAASGVALATAIYMAMHHWWNSFPSWAMQTGILTAGLGASWAGVAGVARGLRGVTAPNHRGLSPNAAAAAMLVEIAVLLVLPLAPAVAVAVWAGEWIFELHITGQAHDLSFHLGRVLQSLVMAGWLYLWVRSMIAIQGRIASSLIRQR
jgi:hypothetical protein